MAVVCPLVAAIGQAAYPYLVDGIIIGICLAVGVMVIIHCACYVYGAGLGGCIAYKEQ